MRTNISEGSVATYLRKDGIFSYQFTNNSSLSPSANFFGNWPTFGISMDESIVAPFSLGTVCNKYTDRFNGLFLC